MLNNREYKYPRNSLFASIIATLVLLIAIGILIFVFLAVGKITDENKIGNQELLKKFHSISAGVTYEQERRAFILDARELIMKINNKVGAANAYEYAQLTFDIAAKYKLDPSFLLALQRKESRFDKDAISSAGAIGLTQIMPYTARMLFRVMNLDYCESKLKLPEVNIECGAAYLDIISCEYPKLELQLACYNGGGKQAYYYKISSPKLSPETKEYVPSVIKYYRKYCKILGGAG